MSFSIVTHRNHCRAVSAAEIQSAEPTGPCLTIRMPPADPAVLQGIVLKPDLSMVRSAGHSPAFPGGFLARLDGGTLIPPYSQLADGSTVLWDSWYQWGGQEAIDRHRQAIETHFKQPRRSVSVPGSHIALARDCDLNWGHWLIEIVPSLALAEGLPALADAKVVVPAGLSPTQRELLSAVGVSEDRLLLYPPDQGVYEFERLYWPSSSFHLGMMSPHVPVWLKSKLFQAYGIPDRSTRRRLYVSRQDAPRARIRNEDELIARLIPEGYEIVVPSQLSLAEQVALFASADVVMGPHGAGLTSTIFCQPDTLLISLNERDGWFMSFSAWCGFVYGATELNGIDFDPVTEDGAVNIDHVLHFADWMIRTRDAERRSGA